MFSVDSKHICALISECRHQVGEEKQRRIGVVAVEAVAAVPINPCSPRAFCQMGPVRVVAVEAVLQDFSPSFVMGLPKKLHYGSLHPIG